MSENDKDKLEKKEYREEQNAGTNEDYFSLLDRRRVELANKRDGKKPVAPPPQRNENAILPQSPNKPTLSPKPPLNQKPPLNPKSSLNQKPPMPSQTSINNRPKNRTVPAVSDEYRRQKAIEEAKRRAEEQKRQDELKKRREAEQKAQKMKEAAEAARQQEIKRRIKEKKRAELRLQAVAAGENVLLFFVVFVFISAVLAGGFLIYLLGTEKNDLSDGLDFVYRVEDSSQVVESDKIIRDDVVFVDFSGIAKLCELTVSGNEGEMCFSYDGDQATFYPETPFADQAFVNGTYLKLAGGVFVRDGKLWVPLSFVRDCFIGVDVKISPLRRSGIDYHLLEIARSSEPSATGAGDSFCTPSFRIKAETVLERIGADDIPYTLKAVEPPESAPEFISDLSVYERYMSPGYPERDNALIVVGTNENCRLTYEYIPAELKAVSFAPSQGELMLCKNAAKAFDAMMTEAAANGFSGLMAMTAYISFDKTARLFDSSMSFERNYSKNNYAATGRRFSETAYSVLGADYLNENYISKNIFTLSLLDAKRVVLTYCDEPGTDEHQSGLAVDVFDSSSPSQPFSQSAAYRWLCENADKFGFILRYPQNKVSATGREFEPWHFRYVGRYHASRIYSSGVCLEEYSYSAP